MQLVNLDHKSKGQKNLRTQSAKNRCNFDAKWFGEIDPCAHVQFPQKMGSMAHLALAEAACASFSSCPSDQGLILTAQNI